MRNYPPMHDRKRAALTNEERREILSLAPSMRELSTIMRMNPETIMNITTPYGRACAPTIERVRARLAELRASK